MQHGIRLQSELSGDRDFSGSDRDWTRIGRILDLFCDDPVTALHARRIFGHDAPIFRHGLLQISWGDREDGLLSRHVWLNEEVAAAIVGDLASISHLCPGLVDTQPSERLDDLVLADDRKALLRRLLDLQRRGCRAGAVGPSGPTGTLVLFVGPTGTGKTLAAKALAGEAGRPLLVLEGDGSEGAGGRSQRGGLSDLLEVAFARAHREGAVLLLDECDRFFDLDHHDRMSAPDLLLVLDRARGLVVLATNRPARPDEALERRILYRIDFPIPCATERERIWHRHLPEVWPIPSEEVAGLARRFVLTGGFVRNAVARVAQALAANGEGFGSDGTLRNAIEEAARHEETRLPWIREVYVPVEVDVGAGQALLPDGQAAAWITEVAAHVRARRTDPRLWRLLASGRPEPMRILLQGQDLPRLEAIAIALARRAGARGLVRLDAHWLKSQRLDDRGPQEYLRLTGPEVPIMVMLPSAGEGADLAEPVSAALALCTDPARTLLVLTDAPRWQLRSMARRFHYLLSVEAPAAQGGAELLAHLLVESGWEHDLGDLAPWRSRLDLDLAVLRRVVVQAATASVARGGELVTGEDLDVALRQVEAARAWCGEPPILGRRHDGRDDG